MNRPITIASLLVAATAILLALTRSAAGQLPNTVTDDIIVGNSDAIRYENVVSSSGLTAKLDTVAVRIPVEYANAVRFVNIAPPPGGLAALLGQVAERILLEYANSIRQVNLSAPPSALFTLLGQVSPRIVIEYADADLSTALTYPMQLIKDETAPIIDQPSGSGAKIVWTTNEFSSTVLRYGTSPGQLNEQIIEPLFAKDHEITLPSLEPGMTYYYQIVATDLSGNVTTSPVYKISGELRLYLPIVRSK